MKAIFNKTIILVLPIVCSVSFIQADTVSDFSEWQQDTLGQFQAYKEARDKEFVDQLANQWIEMQTMKGMIRDPNPKPVITPRIEKIPDTIVPETTEPEENPQIIDIPMRVIEDLKQIVPEPVILKLPLIPSYKLKIAFYGHSLFFNIPKSMSLKLKKNINSKAIAKAWQTLSQSDYENVVRELEIQTERLELGDWAKLQLVQQLVEKVRGFDQNEQTLLTWFLLSKLEFDTRIAYKNNRVYLMLASQHTLYGTSYMSLKGINYYFISNRKSSTLPGNFYTYESDYGNANHSLDMSFEKVARFSEDVKARKLSFDWQQTRFELNIAINQNRINFFENYPQVDLALYFHSTPGAQAKQQLIKQIQPLINGKSEKEAANLILKMVQTSLKYATDGQQFGEENYLLPDETLFYPASDCEDRSVLFAWLIRELLGLDVIALNYPGHVATAIAFKGRVSGDKVIYKGRSYTLADPTYINAKVGMTMPAFRNVKAEVIPI